MRKHFHYNIPVLATVLSFCTAANWYVTTNGTDAGDGSITNPWQTIANAIAFSQSNDVINVGTGAFVEAFTIPEPLTITGQDSYLPGNPPLARHQSRTIIRPPAAGYDRAITLFTNNIKIQNISIFGDSLTNGASDTRCGIYSTYRPMTVSNCLIANFKEKGIEVLASNTPALPADDDTMRCYFGYNTISNIVTTNYATGIFLSGAPATCEHNDIANIGGYGSQGGIYTVRCGFTSNMSDMLSITSNYFSDCWMAVWANAFAATGNFIRISGNIVTNSLIGIRITSAYATAYVQSNVIHISGVSTTEFATPARGIWIEADSDPWDTLTATDHQITDNLIFGSATSNDGTAGIFCSYDSFFGNNNGVRASVYNNTVTGFYYGAYLRSGTSGISVPSTQLVYVGFNNNNIYNNLGDDLYTTGFSYALDRDSDGHTDWEESAITGTDATNPLSVFRIIQGTSVSGTNFTLTWSSVTNRIYYVYKTTNLQDGFGLPVTNKTGTPPTNSYTDTNAILDSIFYRISVTN